MKMPFGKKKAAAGSAAAYGAHKHHEDHKDIGKPATKKGRTALLLATLLGLASLVIFAVGLGLLQSSSHDEDEADRLRGDSEVGSYNDAFQSAHYTPYPNSHHRQWMLLWWIFAGSAFTWLLTLLLAFRAARVIQWRPALVGLHTYFLVLCTFAIDSFLLFAHEDYHERFFGRKRWDTVLAGLFGLAIAHGLAILALGLIANKMHLDNRHINTGIRERVVEKQVEVPVAHHSSHHERPDTHLESAAPVRVHTGAARITEPHVTPGHAAPVQVHQGGVIPKSGPRELGTQRY